MLAQKQESQTKSRFGHWGFVSWFHSLDPCYAIVECVLLQRRSQLVEATFVSPMRSFEKSCRPLKLYSLIIGILRKHVKEAEKHQA